MAVDELFGYAAEGGIMALFDFLVIAVIVGGTVRIISRWYGPKKGSPTGQSRHWSNASTCWKPNRYQLYTSASACWRTSLSPRMWRDKAHCVMR
jgi:hypothetical protein